MYLLQSLLAQEVNGLINLVRLDGIKATILLTGADLVEHILDVAVGPFYSKFLYRGGEVCFRQGTICCTRCLREIISNQSSFDEASLLYLFNLGIINIGHMSWSY